MKRATILALGLFVPIFVGCGDDDDGGGGGASCESICEAALECPDAEEEDCAEECAEIDALTALTGCSTEEDDIWACAEGLGDICTAGDDCTDEFTAYSECVVAYCEANPDNC